MTKWDQERLPGSGDPDADLDVTVRVIQAFGGVDADRLTKIQTDADICLEFIGIPKMPVGSRTANIEEEGDRRVSERIFPVDEVVLHIADE